jgi:hypothetical protein
MTDEHYLTISYFGCASLSLGLGVVVWCLLRRPIAGIVDSLTAKFHGGLLKRAHAALLIGSAFLGFLSVSYTQKGCVDYEHIVKDRSYVVQRDREQVAAAADWTAYAVIACGILGALFLARATHPEK